MWPLIKCWAQKILIKCWNGIKGTTHKYLGWGLETAVLFFKSNISPPGFPFVPLIQFVCHFRWKGSFVFGLHLKTCIYLLLWQLLVNLSCHYASQSLSLCRRGRFSGLLQLRSGVNKDWSSFGFDNFPCPIIFRDGSFGWSFVIN